MLSLNIINVKCKYAMQSCVYYDLFRVWLWLVLVLGLGLGFSFEMYDALFEDPNCKMYTCNALFEYSKCEMYMWNALLCLI
jgi:hypothetical protein